MKLTIAICTCLLGLSAPAFSQDLYLLNSDSPKCGITNASDTQGSLSGYDHISSFSVGGTAPAANTGVRPTFSDLVIQKSVDTCSTPLISQFLTGSPISSITLVEVKPVGGTQAITGPTMKITLVGVIVDSFSLSQDMAQNRTAEQISFRYQKIGITTFKTDSYGNPLASPIPATTMWYDWNNNMLGTDPSI